MVTTMPFAAAVAAQVRYLLSNCSKKNSRTVATELAQLTDLYGVEGHVLVLQALLEQVDLQDHKTLSTQPKLQLLSAELEQLAELPHAAAILLHALTTASLNKDGFLKDVAVALKPAPDQLLALAVAMTEASDPELRQQGFEFLHTEGEELITNLTKSLPEDFVHKLCCTLKSQHSSGQFADLIPARWDHEKRWSLRPLFLDELQEVNCLRDFTAEAVAPFELAHLASQLATNVRMADVFEELGYSSCASKTQFLEVVDSAGGLVVNEKEVARLLGMMARTHTGLEDSQGVHLAFCTVLGALAVSTGETGTPSSWNLEVVASALQQLAPNLNWVDTICHLDYEGFYLPDLKGLALIVSMFEKCATETFPVHAVCGKLWKNIEGQLSFLQQATSAPQDSFSFVNAPNRQQAPIDGLAVSKSPMTGFASQHWLSLDLMHTLVLIAEGHYAAVRGILDVPLKQCPELLLTGLAQLKEFENSVLWNEMVGTLLPVYLANHPNSSVVLHRVWPMNNSLVLRAMVDMHSKDPGTVSRVLDVAQDLKVLPTVLDVPHYSFSIDVAALASRREYLNLEKWLNDKIAAHRSSFFQACLNFLNDKISSDLRTGDQSLDGQPTGNMGLTGRNAGVVLSVETAAVFFRVLQSNSNLVDSDLGDEVRRLFAVAVQAMPRLPSVTSEQPAAEAFASDVEEEANSYFQKIYTSQQSIEDVLQMLKGFKSSSQQREQDIFACMIHNLFDEYRFFPKYPDKELRITAILFGSLIQHQLVSSITLGIALRYVLDALRKPLQTKMFMFGLVALEQFKARLAEWPQYCSHILQIQHMRQAHPEMIAAIERLLHPASQSAAPPAPSALPESLQYPQAGLAAGVMGSELFELPAQDSAEPRTVAAAAERATGGEGQQHVDTSTPGGGDHKAPAQAEPAQSAAPQQAVPTPASAVPPRTPERIFPREPPKTPERTVSGSFYNAASPARPSSGVLPNSLQPPPAPSFATALNIDTLITAVDRLEDMKVPSEGVQDKLHFLINNISAANLDVKAQELLLMINPDYTNWFAQYMVVKRASIEPNFHELYISVLDKLNAKNVHQEVLKATHENVRVLLLSEKIKSSSSERSLLKNLGSWLGRLTIGRNKPLLQKDLNPKALITEAYEKGRMIAVIPFVSKVLESCKNSKIFRPPNPWVMAVISLLAEIYAVPELKLNLKFEIEVLCKHLSLEISDISPSQLLVGRSREQFGNPDFNPSRATPAAADQPAAVVSPLIAPTPPPATPPAIEYAAPPAPATPAASTITSAPSMPSPLVANISTAESTEDLVLAPTPPAPTDAAGPSITGPVGAFAASAANTANTYPDQTLIPNLRAYVQINPSLSVLNQVVNLKRLVPLAVDRAIREIISPVVERSVTIASMTTREFIMKDFAMEPDEGRMRKAAHLMVSSLAGSLALVTCKEPLRVSMANHHRQLLQAFANSIEPAALEQAVQLATADNLELGCSLIEKAATEKAIHDIDEALQQAYTVRIKHREQTGQPYYDMSIFASGRYPSALPDALRPKPGRMTPAQQRVYEDFARLPRQPPPTPRPYGQPGPPGGDIDLERAASMNSMPFLGAPAVPSGDLALREGATTPSDQSSSLMAGAMTMPLHDAQVVSRRSSSGASEFAATSEPSMSTGEVIDKYRNTIHKVDVALSQLPASAAQLDGIPNEAELRALIAEIPDHISQAVSRDEAALAIAQKVFNRLYEHANSRIHIFVHLTILEAVRDTCKRVDKQLTSWVIYSEEERKLNREIIIGLFRSNLINAGDFSMHLAKLMDGGRHAAATELAIHLVKVCIIQEHLTTATEMFNVLDALSKIAQRPGAPEALLQLLERARPSQTNAADESGRPKDRKAGPVVRPPSAKDEKHTPRDAGDLPGLREQVVLLFDEWARICETNAGGGDKAYTSYILQLQQSGLLKNDDLLERFFRILTEVAVAHCNVPDANATHQPAVLSFTAVDMYSKLVVLLVKYYGDPAAGSSNISRINLFNKVLGVTVRVIQRDADERRATFNPRPYFRLFVDWLMDLNAADPLLDSSNFQVLMAFGNAFLALQPLRLPSFSFAWLELVSHRLFMPKLLMAHSQKGWPLFQRLLVALFKFMEPYLRNAELNLPVRLLYKGTLRVLLVLLHDFPEFLCDNHFNLCDVIPPTCIQLRNLILSAFPRNMRLPDPFTPNLKVDLLPEISQSPRILSDVEHVLRNKQLKGDLDQYLKARQPVAFIVDLRQRLLLLPQDAMTLGTRYDVPLINALVLYVGIQAIQQLQSKSPQAAAPITHSAPMDVFQRLVSELDSEGRYFVLNAIANQLRYPNNHTHYFSCVLLYLFAEAHQEVVQEQITRVLLERLIVNRPHPWGLLITFIELIKNPRYNFWSHRFTRCAPEIERLFESVARSCMGPPPKVADDDLNQGPPVNEVKA
eukprot:jgi/Chlat1/6260/Chrsp44S05774